MWHAAIRGDEVDWHGLFEGFEATVDFPACVFYRELMAAFPDAKVVLSVRDPERWWNSYSKLVRLVKRATWLNLPPSNKLLSTICSSISYRRSPAAFSRGARLSLI